MAPTAANSTRRVGNSTEHAFSTEDVIVAVPDQSDGKPVRIQKDAVTTVPAMYNQPDFKPKRIVMNLLLVKDPDPGQKTALVISPAVEIRVKVTQQDITNAGSLDKVKMAYWYNDRWNIFGAKHGFKIEGGYAKAALSAWGDPAIGMGP